MAIDPLSILYMGVFLAVACGLYGWLIAILWSPFLLAGRVRRLFDSLPSGDWRVNYALWMPLPSVLWGFLCGCVVALSLDVRTQTRAASLYAAGVDGITVATAISILLWPTLSLYAFPTRGFDWYAGENTQTTVLLIVVATAWYLLLLAVPTYAIAAFAGFGQAMSHG